MIVSKRQPLKSSRVHRYIGGFRYFLKKLYFKIRRRQHMKCRFFCKISQGSKKNSHHFRVDHLLFSNSYDICGLWEQNWRTKDWCEIGRRQEWLLMNIFHFSSDFDGGWWDCSTKEYCNSAMWPTFIRIGWRTEIFYYMPAFGCVRLFFFVSDLTT